jgi:hypothetical protein
MSQNFIAVDREQAFLLPPDVRDWLPESHLAWFVLDAVGQMDLSAFYAAYRRDGWGRPAYDPAEHWRHLRTTNPIESSFATVKLRTKVTKGAGSKKAALAMAYKLLDTAQERWRRFNGHELVTDVLDGTKFKDGIKVTDDETTTTNEKVAA